MTQESLRRARKTRILSNYNNSSFTEYDLSSSASALGKDELTEQLPETRPRKMKDSDEVNSNMTLMLELCLVFVSVINDDDRVQQRSTDKRLRAEDSKYNSYL